MTNVIQSMWIGESLSTMEQLSITSFLKSGHEYHLYVYEDVKGVPSGAIVKDANAILASPMIFQYNEQKSYAGFSNFFRYKLLLERGGWWVDTDVVCLRPFKFESEHVLATERDPRGREFVTSGIIHAPIGSELMRRAWVVCQSKDPKQLRWGETGPMLMHELSMRLSFCQYAQPADTFCPIDPANWIQTVLPFRQAEFGQATYAVHLWNELWRRHGLDKDEVYAPGSLYEQWKRQHFG